MARESNTGEAPRKRPVPKNFTVADFTARACGKPLLATGFSDFCLKSCRMAKKT
jgi:hypothetical protein